MDRIINSDFEAKFNNIIKTKYVGRKFVCFDELESTFIQARELAKLGSENGTVVLANYQTNGRGRLGRSWSSSKGQGLYFSVICKSELRAEIAPRFTIAVAVGVCLALRELGFDAKIKWSNDIIVCNRKVGGILLELKTKNNSIDYLLAGIGLNVSQKLCDFSEELHDKAGSLQMFCESEVDRAKVFAKVLEGIENMIDLLHNDFDSLLSLYKKHSATLGKRVVASGGSCAQGVAVDINENGELIVQDEQGELHCLNVGDVSVRGIMGYV